MEVSESSAPSWARELPEERDPRYHHDVGESTAESPEGALKDARKDAAVKVVNYWFSEYVTEDYRRTRKDEIRSILDKVATQSEGSLAGGKQIKSKVVRVRVHQADGSVRYRFRAYVLIRYNMVLLNDAISQFKELKARHAILRIECKSTPHGACGESFIRAGATSAAENAGIHVVETISGTIGAGREQHCRRARDRGAIFLLLIQLEGRFARDDGHVNFATTNASASLIETRGCSVREQWSPTTTDRPFKEGVVKEYGGTRLAAVLKSLRQSLFDEDEGLIQALKSWKD